jgi:hypothetical protein
MESGAIDALHAPSALMELTLDEVALAGVGIGPEGLASYLTGDRIPDVDELFPDTSKPSVPIVQFHPDVMLGYLSVDVAPPSLWLERLSGDSVGNERLARELALMAQQTGKEADTVEVHMEGALDASEEGWADEAARVRPAGVSVHFSFEIPLEGTGERELGHIFLAGSRTAATAIEAMRRVFERIS